MIFIPPSLLPSETSGVCLGLWARRSSGASRLCCQIRWPLATCGCLDLNKISSVLQVQGPISRSPCVFGV